MTNDYLESAIKQFEYYKMFGEKTFAQLPDEKLFWQYNELAQYPYHIRQIVFIGKMAYNDQWSSVSVAKRTSKEYNADKFSTPKHKAHFTDEFLGKK